MATQRSSFAKLQRDRDRQAKAAAKRDRRQNREQLEGEEPVDEPVLDSAPTEEILAQVATLHEQFDAGLIDFESFEDRKATLLGRLSL
ncbi:MAG TPA: hypothetical protein VMV14_06315 [Acidimicrobiales bacterium]|nr:hypothetical protein [Acidimicrobiales bacterium]